MDVNQKGFAHILLPAVMLVVITSVFATANISTSTKYSDNQAQGVLAARAAEKSNGNSDRSSDSQNNQGRSVEAQTKQETRTTKTNDAEDKPTTSNRESIKTSIKQAESSEDAEIEDEASDSADEDLSELRATSKFPLRIDLATNQLIMTKNGVERVLTVLPAKAVFNMLLAHLKTGVGPKFFGDATASATLSASLSASVSGQPIATESAITVLENQITLEEENGQPVYRIPAKKQLKLFGLIPITTDITGFISADTGALIREQQSLLSRILDFLSTK